MGEAEMMAITIPVEYGGLGLGYTERMIAVEEVSRVSVAAAMMLQVFALGIEPSGCWMLRVSIRFFY